MAANGFKNLIVWQKAIDFCIQVYSVSAKFPDHEKFSLISQLRRAAVSISANIAEGCSRKSRKEFTQFLWVAYGSLAEVESHLTIASKLGYLTDTDLMLLLDAKEEIRKMIKSLINKQ